MLLGGFLLCAACATSMSAEVDAVETCKELRPHRSGELLPWKECPVGVLGEAKEDEAVKTVDAECRSVSPGGIGEAAELLSEGSCAVGVLGETRRWLTIRPDPVLGDSQEQIRKEETKAKTSGKILRPGMVVTINGGKMPHRVLDAGEGFIAIVSGAEPYAGANRT